MRAMTRHRRDLGFLGCGTAVALAAGLLGAPAARAVPVAPDARSCPPAARAVGFSDGLDGVTRNGVTVGGLSALAYDRFSRSFVAAVDNNNADPARLWFLRRPLQPVVTRDPLVLRRPGGTPYTGVDSDNEGLAVLRDGSFLVSSEKEPSIRVFGRDGVQRAELPVPARFRVAPAGEATGNATLEGLTLTPGKTRAVAAMEGTLSGDKSATGDNTYRRMLVYDRGLSGRWVLAKQVGYQVDAGFRVAEVNAYGPGGLLVLEAAFSGATGNAVRLYAVRRLGTAPDVTGTTNLSEAPRRYVMRKRLVADVTTCPTLGATSQEPQANPLMDNYEGMTVLAGPRRRSRVVLVSDDNLRPTQTTRLLVLAARLPR